jgi:hypothetical protein
MPLSAVIIITLPPSLSCRVARWRLSTVADSFVLRSLLTVYRTRPGGGTEDLTTSRGDARRAQTERRSRGWPKVAGVTGGVAFFLIIAELIISISSAGRSSFNL